MKVLMIGNLNGGGRERRMAQLICGLAKDASYIVKVLVFNEIIDYKEVFDSGVSIEYAKSTGRIELFKEIENIIASFRPEIVHMWAAQPRQINVGSILKIKYGYKYIAGFVATGTPLPFFSRENAAYQFAYLMSDAIVSNSNVGLKARRVPRNKAYVIYNGFDFNRFNNCVKKEQIRRSLGISSKYVVVMMARIDASKDWDTFLQVAEILQKEEVDVSMLSVGDGYNKGVMMKKAERLGLKNVVFAGRRNDVESILNASDISVLFSSNSSREGVSNSILESMAAGLPVIATNSGGTPEIIQDGINGYLVKHHDYIKVVSIIKELIDNSVTRQQIGTKARIDIQNRFSLEKMVQEYKDLYLHLL